MAVRQKVKVRDRLGDEFGLGQIKIAEVADADVNDISAIAIAPGFEKAREYMSSQFHQAAENALSGNRKYWNGFRDGLEAFFVLVGSSVIVRSEFMKLSGIDSYERDKLEEEASTQPTITLGGSYL